MGTMLESYSARYLFLMDLADFFVDKIFLRRNISPNVSLMRVYITVGSVSLSPNGGVPIL